MARIDFNPAAAPEQGQGGAGPMPEGEYVAIIVKSDIKANAARNGEYIELECDVLAPAQYKGRKFWHNINHISQSEKAQAIGQGQLRALCELFGVARLTDTTALHGKPFGAKLGIELGTDNGKGGKYPDKNHLKYIKAASDVVVAAAAPAQARPAQPAQAPASQPAAGAPAPWDGPARTLDPPAVTGVTQTTTASAKAPWEN